MTSLRNQKQRYRRSKVAPEVDDTLLIHEDKSPRQNWKLGRIVELIISKDNVVRAAKVILGSRKILERPINKLYPVENGKMVEVDRKFRYDNLIEFDKDDVMEKPNNHCEKKKSIGIGKIEN